MVSARRLIALRLTAMAALCVSTLLTYDSLNPERAFCSLAESCEKVRESALGRIFGVPTSLVGVAAFGGLFLLTLLPIEWARRLLKPAGFVSALAGMSLFAYQAVVIRTFCPFCLVADAAGLVAGLLTITWGELPRRRSGKRLGGESAAARVAWTLAAILAVVLPFAWPRQEKPAWVEIAPTTAVFDDPADADPVEPGRPGLAQAPEPEPLRPAQPTPPPASAHLPPPPAVSPGAPAAEPPRAEPPRPAPEPPRLAPEPPRSTGSAVPPPAPAARAAVTVVEYLNAYCAHCRATHKRLAKVRAESGIPVRVRRVYTWASTDVPAWARACAFAATVGLEDALFEALLETRNEDPRELYGAARRVGLDVNALQRALSDPTPPPRLLRDRQLFQAAGLQGLPTLDIGRRRLMGEQSEAELRAALEAAW